MTNLHVKMTVNMQMEAQSVLITVSPLNTVGSAYTPVMNIPTNGDKEAE